MSAFQSSPADERPCKPPVMVPEDPAVTVSCATTTSPPGASPGLIQNTAPSVTSVPLSAVQESQSMPIELIAPAAFAVNLKSPVGMLVGNLCGGFDEQVETLFW